MKPKPLRNPREPTQAEIDNHKLTHVPFREWCRWCIEGKCPTREHSNRNCGAVVYEEAIPNICFDYCYLNIDDEKKGNNPVIAMHSSSSKAICTLPAGKKGADGCEWLVMLLTMELQNWGHGLDEVIFKCDNEHSIEALVDAVARY